MKKATKIALTVITLIAVFAIFFSPVTAFAAETAAVEAASAATAKAYAAGIAIAITAGLGALGMGFVIAKTMDAVARQPEAEGKLRTIMMLGLVFVETAIIYALIVAILIIFVL